MGLFLKVNSTVGVLAILSAGVALVTCGGAESGSSGPAGAGGRGVIAVSQIENCGGFTPEMAGSVMAEPGSEIEARKERIHDTSLACTFASQEGSVLVSFSLSWEETVEELEETLAMEKENLELALTTIAGATGKEVEEPAVVIVEGIGEEAFWTPVNDTVVARVGNVRIQVMMPNDREKQKEVARRVAAGLR